MAYTYQSFATLGVNLNRQNYGALDISQVFNSQGDLNYYLSKGTDKSAVSNYWKDIVPYPYEGQVLATVFGGEVKVYVLALNAEGNFVCQNVGDTSAVEAAIAELEEALATARTEISAEIDADVKVAKDRADEAYTLAESKVDSTTYATDKAALEAEDAAIRAIAEGARDTINSFLTSEEVDETVNTLKEIQAELDKMTDATELAEALAGKADKATTLAGYGITDAYTKAETDKAIADKVSDVTGGESAAAVKLLLEAEVTRSTEKDNAHDSAIETINSKLSGIEAGAQVNKIETIKVNGTALTITDKAVDITVPTDYLTSADKTSLTGLISTAQKAADDAAAAASTNAGAITTLSGTVSDQGDLIGQHATAIDALQKSLAESGAVGSKIAALENSAKSHDESIVTINNTLATKVDASALDSYLLTSTFDTKIADYYKKTEVEAILGNRGDKDIVTLINEAKIAATYNDSEVRGLIGANTTAINEEITRAKAAEKANADEIARVNGVLVDAIENNAEGLDSIKELADWINNHGTTVSGLTEAIEKNAEDILTNANAIKTINKTTIPALEEEVKAYADTAVANFAASEFIFNGGSASTNLWTEAIAE